MAESPNQPNRLDPKRKSLDDADLYELNLDDDDPAPAAPPRPRKPTTPAPPTKSTAGPKANDEDTYDLAEVEKPRPRTKAPLRPELDPRLADGAQSTDKAGEPPRPKVLTDAAERAAQEGRPIPKLYQSEPEPETVDPAVAARKREEARVRAAQELAEEEARKFRIKMIVIAVLFAIIVILYFFWSLIF